MYNFYLHYLTVKKNVLAPYAIQRLTNSMQLNARTLSMNQFSDILRIKVTLNCEFHSQWTAQSAAIHGDLCTNILQPRTLSKKINKKDIQTVERLWCNPILIQNKALASKVILFFHNIVPKEKKRKTRTHDSLHIYPTTAASYKINGAIQKYNSICFSNTETYIES